jgi:hypothetical protein
MEEGMAVGVLCCYRRWWPLAAQRCGTTNLQHQQQQQQVLMHTGLSRVQKLTMMF